MIYRLQNIHDMEIKIENILILWCQSDKHLVLEFQRKGNPQFNGETFRKRELRKAVRLRLWSASPLGCPKDDNRPRKGNGEPTADC